MCETLFNSLVESLQKNPGQEPNRIRGTDHLKAEEDDTRALR